MKLSDFDFELPAELIAQYPTAQRSQSRLLVISQKKETFDHQYFYQLPQHLRPGDLLVFNDTRVMPARFYGVKETGGKIEILIERIIDETNALAHVKASKALRAGMSFYLNDKIQCKVLGRQGDLYHISCGNDQVWDEIMAAVGHIPLPPYIQRTDEQEDLTRYQTIFARNQGAVAAPTAGLHFDEALWQTLQQQGIEFGFVTLHVGSGTFQPIRTDTIAEHRMHSEYLEVSPQVCAQIAATRARGGRVIAVGTTVVRCLETAALQGELQPYYGETTIFIYPGFQFKVIDGLISNFHLPRSTLLMLVSALIGREKIMAAYQQAVAEEYRFFSYGDAMIML